MGNTTIQNHCGAKLGSIKDTDIDNTDNVIIP